jgi:hypothetical protein
MTALDYELSEGAYYWRVRAKDNAENYSDWSSTREFKIDLTPSAPMGINGTAVSTESISWTWYEMSDTEDGFRIMTTTDGVVAGLPANTTTWLETGLSPNTLYHRYVEAYRGSIISSAPYIGQAYTLANPPINSTMQLVTSNTIRIQWSGNGNTEGTVYEINRSTDGITFQLLASTVAISYVDFNLSPLTSYSYQVRAVNGVTIPSAFDLTVTTETSPAEAAQPEFGAIAGKITKTDGATGISQALVEAMLVGGSQSAVGSSITDINGKYSIILGTGNYDVKASSYGYEPQTVAAQAVVANSTTTVNIQLVASAPVTGQIYGAEVSSGGAFAVTGLPIPGNYYVISFIDNNSNEWPDNTEPWNVNYWAVNPGAQYLSGGTPIDVGVIQLYDFGGISGYVNNTSTQTGKIVIKAAGAYTTTYNNAYENEQKIAASSGSYTIYVATPSNPYKVTAWVDENSNGTLDAGEYFAETEATINVSPAGLITGINLEITGPVVPQTYSISGYVIGNDTTVANVALTLAGTSTGVYVTSGGGYYEFLNLAAGGSYTITPEKANYTFVPSSAVYTNLSASWTNQTFEAISMGATYYTLTVNKVPSIGGTVTPLGGTYSTGTVVNLAAIANSGYKFESWAGVDVLVSSDAYASTATVKMSSDKTVTANFAFVPPLQSSGVIAGMVTASSGTTPITGALVEAFRVGVPQLAVGSSIADINGNYSIILSTGIYDVRASSYGYQAQISTGQIVTADSTTTVNFQLLTIPGSAPAAPSNLLATEVTNSSIKWVWKDNADNETGYKVARSTTGAIIPLPVNTSSYVETGLQPNTYQEFNVRAYNGVGASSAIFASVYTLANLPTNFVCSTKLFDRIKLEWNANSNPVNTRYELNRSSDGLNYVPLTTYYFLLSYADTGLEQQTTYYYRLYSINEDGIKTGPAELSVVTPASLTKGPIAGKVTQSDGQPITGVSVQLYNEQGTAQIAETFTGSDGTYRFEQVEDGVYRVMSSWLVNDIESMVYKTGIPENSEDVAFTLEIQYQLAMLSGRITLGTRPSFSGRFAPGQQPYVELLQRSKVVAKVNADNNGNYTVPNLLPGSYVIRVFNGVQVSEPASVTVREGEQLAVNFRWSLGFNDSGAYAYPNPARAGIVTIRYSVLNTNHSARIRIFNIAGELIREAKDDEITLLGAGVYGFVWDMKNDSGNDIASGVYIYILDIKETVAPYEKVTVKKKLAVIR